MQCSNPSYCGIECFRKECHMPHDSMNDSMMVVSFRTQIAQLTQPSVAIRSPSVDATGSLTSVEHSTQHICPCIVVRVLHIRANTGSTKIPQSRLHQTHTIATQTYCEPHIVIIILWGIQMSHRMWFVCGTFKRGPRCLCLWSTGAHISA